MTDHVDPDAFPILDADAILGTIEAAHHALDATFPAVAEIGREYATEMNQLDLDGDETAETLCNMQYMAFMFLLVTRALEGVLEAGKEAQEEATLKGWMQEEGQA